MIAFVSYCVNSAYSRMKAMHNLLFEDSYQEDLISDGAADFVYQGQNNIF